MPILVATFKYEDGALRPDGERGRLVEEPSVDQRRRKVGGGLAFHDHAMFDAIIAHGEPRDFNPRFVAPREGGQHLPARLLPVISHDMHRRVIHLHRQNHGSAVTLSCSRSGALHRQTM